MNKFLNVLLFVVYVLTIIAVAFGLLSFQSVIVMYMWNWFIAPLGISSIGFWHAMGISLTIGIVFAAFFSNLKKEEKNENVKGASYIIGYVVGHVIGYLLIWGLGALIHCFM